MMLTINAEYVQIFQCVASQLQNNYSPAVFFHNPLYLTPSVFYTIILAVAVH